MWKRDTSPMPANAPVELTPERPTPVTPVPKPIDARPADTIMMNLGKSMMIKGELSASEDLMLCGHVEGRVTVLDHTLTIGPEAHIGAEIKANTVVIMGAVHGNIVASKKVEVRATGSVTGDIAAPRIVIADGGQLLGKVQVNSEKRVEARRTA